MEKLKNNKIFKIGVLVFRIILFIVMIGFILSVCLQRFSNNKLSIFNFRMFTVISGSMEPRYKIGDVLIAKEIKPENIKVISKFDDYLADEEVKEHGITKSARTAATR